MTFLQGWGREAEHVTYLTHVGAKVLKWLKVRCQISPLPLMESFEHLWILFPERLVRMFNSFVAGISHVAKEKTQG